MQPRARSLSILGLALGVALSAGAASAGTVYVPLPGVTTVGSASWEAEVSIANGSTQPIVLSGLLLAQDTDGTQRSTLTPAAITVGAAQTAVVRPGAAFAGLAELAGSPSARYAARLAGRGTVGQLGVALPVITSANSVAAGGALSLQGLAGSATRTTSLVLVNLGKVAGQCTVTLLGANGGALAAPSTLSLKPLSQLAVASAFAGMAALADARAHVTCTREFFAYALTTDSTSGEVAVVEPAGNGESTLTRPGEEPACPPNATCYASTLLFRPTPANPVGHVIFPSPGARVTKRLRMSLDVTVGEWYPADPDGRHLIYWFVINKNLDMPGMLFFRGPEAYTALARWGIGLKHEQKKRATVPFQAIAGHTYRVVNDFDMGAGVYTITITDTATGQTASIVDLPNVAQVTLKATDRFLIDLGFKEGVTPDEVPSFNGWVYTNVRLEVY
jgi:hypothetical protein